MKKILLLNQEGCQREECCTGKISLKVLPSQIILAAAYLDKKGKDVAFVDTQTQNFPNLSEFDIVVVWVSTLDGYYEDMKALKKAKELGKKTILVLNDHYGVEYEVMEKNPFVDVCIRLFEREIVLDKVISYWQNNINKLDFKGVIYRDGDKLVDTGTMPFLKDLSHLGSAEKILKGLKLSKYDEAFITTGRGCPLQCTFCQYPQTSTRKREIKDIFAEASLISAEIDYYNYSDLNLCANLPWANNFLDELAKQKFSGGWVADMRADQARPELLDKFRKAGCARLLIGVESLDDYVLKQIRKRTNKELVEKSIKNILNAKINPITSLMVGFPWDSNETLQKSEEFIKKMSISLFGISYVVPIKGTVLYEDYKKLGLIKKDLGVEDYVNSMSYPLSPTLHLSKEEIVNWSKRLQKIRFNPWYMTNYVIRNGFKPRYVKSFIKRLQNYQSG